MKFTTEKFKEIKKTMDKPQMDDYVNSIYMQGYEKGIREAGSFDAELALQSIGQIKGIGPAKMEQIKLAMLAAGARIGDK